MENEIETTDSTNSQEVTGTETEVEETDDVASLKQKNQELYEQLQKAKGKVRGEDGKWIRKTETAKPAQSVETQKTDGLSINDVRALVSVHEDDVEDVTEYARFRGVSVSEALKSNTLKNIISENAEKRKTAEATNTNASRRGTTKPTGEDLLDRASKGQMPDDVDALAKARLEAKRKK